PRSYQDHGCGPECIWRHPRKSRDLRNHSYQDHEPRLHRYSRRRADLSCLAPGGPGQADDASRLTMYPDRVRDAEARVGLRSLPEVPPELSPVVAAAGMALAKWELDGNATALREFVKLADECLMHPAFPGSGRELRIR